MKVVAQRLRPQTGQKLVCFCLTFGHQVHRTEPARIVERHPRTVVHVKHDVVVFLRRRMVTHKNAQRIARYGHAPRHAKMDQQRLAARQIGQNVFRPAP